MRRITSFIISLTLLCGGMAATSALAYAATTPVQTACGAITDNQSCTDTSGSPSITSVVTTVINVLSLVVGLVAVIMIIVAGLRYVTSGGDSNAVSGAKNTLIYALVGLVIAALAQVLVQFVLKKIT